MAQIEPLNQEKVIERAREMYEARIKREIKKETPVEMPRPSEEEKIKEELHAIGSQPAPSTAQDLVDQFVNNLSALDDRAQLGELIKIAFVKDPRIALKVASSLNNARVLDTLHDLLASDNVYYRLLKEQKL